MTAYLVAISIALFCLTLVAAGILFSHPNVFRVRNSVKAMTYGAFTLDLSGGLLVFGHASLDWPARFLELGACLIMTSGSWTMALFIYVHSFVIPKRKGL